MAKRAPIYMVIKAVAISRDDIMCYCKFRNDASGNSSYDRHREELHPAAVQVGKAMKCNDVAIFLLKLLSIQLPT